MITFISLAVRIAQNNSELRKSNQLCTIKIKIKPQNQRFRRDQTFQPQWSQMGRYDCTSSGTY